jgi:hypothetical protein
MVIEPDRDAPLFALVVKFTVPLPFPLAPEVIEIHGVAVVAVHAQPLAVVTATGVPAPPPAPGVSDVGLIDAAQPPACVTIRL